MKKYFVFILGIFFLPLLAQADWSTGLSIGQTYGLPNPWDGIYGIIDNALLWILSIFTLLAIISFVINGIMFLMAGGSQDMADRAKRGVTYSILGILVGISGYIIIRFLDELLLGVL